MAQDESGWVEWAGGECPVSSETIVAWRVRDTRDNDDHMFRQAERLDWSHNDKAPSDYDIIAYRVVKP